MQWVAHPRGKSDLKHRHRTTAVLIATIIHVITRIICHHMMRAVHHVGHHFLTARDLRGCKRTAYLRTKQGYYNEYVDDGTFHVFSVPR